MAATQRDALIALMHGMFIVSWPCHFRNTNEEYPAYVGPDKGTDSTLLFMKATQYATKAEAEAVAFAFAAKYPELVGKIHLLNVKHGKDGHPYTEVVRE